MKHGRKLLPLGLGAALTLSLVLPCFAAPVDTVYTDVDADAWYAGAVNYVRENGLMGGTSDTTFSPEGAMSRAMLATVLYRAAENEYINGYDDGRFGTSDPVTREQFAAILWRYAGGPDAGTVRDFADEAGFDRRSGGQPGPPAHAEDHVPQGGSGRGGRVCLYLRPKQLFPWRGDSFRVPQHRRSSGRSGEPGLGELRPERVPSASGMPQWEPYTRNSGAAMLLDDEPELVHHHDKELMELLATDYEY